MDQRDGSEDSLQLLRSSFRRRWDGSFAAFLLRRFVDLVIRLANWRSVYLLELALVAVIVWLMLTMHHPAPFYGEPPVDLGGEK